MLSSGSGAAWGTELHPKKTDSEKSQLLNPHQGLSAAPRSQISPLDHAHLPLVLPEPGLVTHPRDPGAGHLRPTAVMVPRGQGLQPRDLLSAAAPAFLRPRSHRALEKDSRGGDWPVGHAPSSSSRPCSTAYCSGGKDTPTSDTPQSLPSRSAPSLSVRVQGGEGNAPTQAHPSALPRPAPLLSPLSLSVRRAQPGKAHAPRQVPPLRLAPPLSYEPINVPWWEWPDSR
jgi:hypothetical protein